MTLKRALLASLATGSLLISQSAAAASLPARTGADVGQSEGVMTSAAWPAIAAILALFVLFGVIALSDDDDVPDSP